MYIKVNNLTQLGGDADYKGLDINLIVGGTQVYPLKENEAYFAYNGVAVDHPDLEVITEEQYLLAKQEYEESIPVYTSPEEEIQQLKLAMAEMAEAHEQEKTEMQLALAELAELLGGEVNHG